MNVVIIGSGNVASTLGRLIQGNNHKVVQVTSRNIEHAKLLADELQSSYTDYSGALDKGADIFIIEIGRAHV